MTAITLGKLMLAPVALIAYIGLAAWAGLLARNPEVVAIGALSAIGYGASFAWFFQGQQRGGTAVMTEAVPQAIYYALVLLLVRGPGDLWLAALTQTIPPLMSLATALVLVKRSGLLGRSTCQRSAASCPRLSLLRRKILLHAIYSHYAGSGCRAVGRLSSGFLLHRRPVHAISGTLSVPVFQATVHWSQNRPPRRRRLAHVAQPGRGGHAICRRVSRGGLSSAAGFLITRFFSADFHPAITVARLCCINSVIAVLGMAFANLVIIPRNVARVMIWSSSLALLFGLAAQFLLVPSYGAVGAALSRGTSETIVTLILGGVSSKCSSGTLRRGQPSRSPPALRACTLCAVRELGRKGRGMTRYCVFFGGAVDASHPCAQPVNPAPYPNSHLGAWSHRCVVFRASRSDAYHDIRLRPPHRRALRTLALRKQPVPMWRPANAFSRSGDGSGS